MKIIYNLIICFNFINYYNNYFFYDEKRSVSSMYKNTSE